MRTKLLRVAVACLACQIVSAQAADEWVAPINSYINIFSSDTNINNSELVVTADDGNPISDVNDTQAFLAKVAVSGSLTSDQTVEMTIDGTNWFAATVLNGFFQHDFGTLPIGQHGLQIRVDGETQFTQNITVTEYVAPPLRVVAGYAPNEVGVGQSFEMSWSPSELADYYNLIAYKGTDESVVSTVANITGTSANYTHSVAEVIVMRVEACNSGGCANPGGTRIVDVKPAVPNQVTNITVPETAYVGEAFDVSWSPVSGANEYNLYIDNARRVTVSSTSAQYTPINTNSISVSVAACDNNGCSSPSGHHIVNVTFNPDAPVANDDIGMLQVQTDDTFAVLENDNDPNGSMLSISSLVGTPSRGTATIVNGGTAIKYENTVGACGGVSSFTDQVKYKIINEEGIESQTAELNLTMNCGPVGLWVQTPVPFNRLAPNYTLYAGIDGYYLKATPSNWLVLGRLFVPQFGEYSFLRMFKQGGQWTSEEVTQTQFASNVRSTAIAGALGQITDIDGGDYQSINILLDVTTPPVANDDNVILELGGSTWILPLSNDAAPGQAYLSISSIVTPAGHGTVALNHDATSFTYTANSSVCAADSFVYEVTNTNGLSDTATVNLSCPVKQLQAIDDAASYGRDVPVTIDVLSNDLIVNYAPPTVAVVTQPVLGTASVVDSQIQYTPGAGVCSADTLTYSLTSEGVVTSAEVTLECTDTFWSHVAITVGQSATIQWNVAGAAYCNLIAPSGPTQYLGASGTQNITFYEVGPMQWQCFDAGDAPIGEAVTLEVDKLAKPTGFDWQ